MRCKLAVRRSGQERRFKDGCYRNASGSTLSEVLFLAATSDKMLFDDKLSPLVDLTSSKLTK